MPTGDKNARKTHCPYGHPYDEANTRRVRYKSGHLRLCKTCWRERMRRERLRPEVQAREVAYRRARWQRIARMKLAVFE